MNAKLDTGRVFERIFKIYGEQFTLLIPAALVLFIPVAIINGLVLASGEGWAFLISALVALVATFWYQGMVVEAVRDIVDGRRDQTVGSLFSSVSPVIGTLIGAGLLAGLIVVIGLILIIVPGLIALTLLALVAPAVVIDRAGVTAALRRSRELVRDNAWRVFGVIVVLFLLQAVATGIVNAIVGGASDDSFVGYAIADLVVRVLLAPLSAIAATVMYIELRRVKGEPLVEDTTGAPAAPPPGPETPPAPEAPAV
jgi:hypothetical protein